jgi:lipoprotein-anchoring transpeptidase ErfK/SrfK
MAVPPNQSPGEGRTRHARRRRHARKRLVVVVGAIVAVVVVVGFGAWALSHDDSVTAAPRSHVKTIVPTTVPSTAPPPSIVATTKVPQLVAYSQPNASAPVVSKFPAKTYYGLPTTLLVTKQQPGWLQALLPIQPNGATGWVRDTDVTLSQTTMHVQVSLSSRYLVLYDGASKVFDTGVGIGKDQTPTPLGVFYVTDPVDLTTRPNGAYGAYALGLSGFSDVLKSFDGGPPQIAVHGDTVAADVGQKVSNGCIRVPNQAIVEIAKRVPLGTPVIVTA